MRWIGWRSLNILKIVAATPAFKKGWRDAWIAIRHYWESDNDAMASRNSQKTHNRAAGKILGGDAFAAISAVEGLSLSAESKRRLDKLRKSQMSPDQRRAEVLRAYMSDNPSR